MMIFATPTSSIIRSTDGFEMSSPPPPPDCVRSRLYIRISDTEQSMIPNVDVDGGVMMIMTRTVPVVPPPPLFTTFPDELMLPKFDHEERHDRNDNSDSANNSTDDSSPSSSELPPARMLQSLSLNKKRRRLSCSSSRSLRGAKTRTTGLVGRPGQAPQQQHNTRQRSPPSLRPLDDPLDSRYVSEVMSSNLEDRGDMDELRNTMIDASSSMTKMDEDDYDEDDEDVAIRTAVMYLNENNKNGSSMTNSIKASFRYKSSMVRNSFSSLASSSAGTSNSKRRTSFESVFVPIRYRS